MIYLLALYPKVNGDEILRSVSLTVRKKPRRFSLPCAEDGPERQFLSDRPCAKALADVIRDVRRTTLQC